MLPASLVAVIRHHHAPPDASDQLVKLVNVADQMANHLTFAGCIEGFVVESVPALESLCEQTPESAQDVAARLMQAAQMAFDDCSDTMRINNG